MRASSAQLGTGFIQPLSGRDGHGRAGRQGEKLLSGRATLTQEHCQTDSAAGGWNPPGTGPADRPAVVKSGWRAGAETVSYIMKIVLKQTHTYRLD
jgi:hypothetical protein